MIFVLVIDRNPNRRAAAANMLARCGYCPLTARGDDEALGLLGQLPIQLVLAPVEPAEPRRGALLDAIRRRFPALPVVALPQPFAPALLIRAVGRCLQQDLAA